MSSFALLIPVRKEVRAGGLFRWPRTVVLASASEADLLPLGQLAQDLRRLGVRARIERNAFGPAAVRIRRDSKISGREAYRLVVTKAGVEIVVSADAGAYYGAQTLRDLLACEGKTLKCRRIDDAPDFARRGVYHDCSRGKVPTVATLKQLVERLARWKINELQLYVENVFTFRRHPDIGRGYSPFTAEELLEVQDHCRKHHVRFVGSLASFGHMEKILALPKYHALSEIPASDGTMGGCLSLCPVDPRSLRLVADLYEEFLPLFAAEDFNVCCDETWDLGKGRSAAAVKRRGAGRVYLDFLLKIHDLCLKHGKRMNAWADIVMEHPELMRELPRDIVMLNWDYAPNGKRMARTGEVAATGLAQVVCPGTQGWQQHGTDLPKALANVSQFAQQGRGHGAEGFLNTDWGDWGHRNLLGDSLHSFAHGAACSWHGKGVDDASFTRTFCFHVFGDAAGRLAEEIAAVGGTHRTINNTGKWVSTYHMIVEPIEAGKSFRRSPLVRTGGNHSWIDSASEDGLSAAVEALAGAKFTAGRDVPEFESLALKELAQSAWMNSFACRRALVARRYRAGKKVSSATFRALEAETRELAVQYRRLWLRRNKLSRLRDNLALFEQAGKEAKSLA
jgi:hypothetical protein